MGYSIEIRKMGESGTPLDRIQSFGAETVPDAVELARATLNSAPRSVHALYVQIFDQTDRLIMAFKSNFLVKKDQ